MQIPCVYIPGPAPAVSVANSGKFLKIGFAFVMDNYEDYDDFLEELAEAEQTADLGKFIVFFSLFVVYICYFW